MGEVRHGPKGADDGGATELIEVGGGGQWPGGDSPVGRCRHKAEEREEGATECSGARSRGRMRGGRKGGGAAATGHPL
jgi:hypothetical protein